ncbi:PucR family transcriptional regulator [Phytohabitans suffuscus]|uniref:Putative regulatory protein n=1 Tax=Phytohabitans suffuscus TaxID=624315 RepID=A0A6F8YUZ9_9ACTN|nr:PucR family transcriptional regulator [Phytohabitans suffuscus]BCB89899.1 putative regulatory protein [Phytohabitans suffuscus]
MSEPPAVSVDWLVARPGLGLRVRAGEAGLRREIRWAHCIELPDPAPWLRGGELVLTTGLRLPRSAAGQRRYVGQLDGAGVSALALGTGLTHQRVPAAMIEAADGLGLPLLEVPYETPFEALTTAVLERLAERRYSLLTWASAVQARMTRAAVRGGSPAVVRELATATGGRALLLAADRSVVAAHPAGEPAAEVLRGWLAGWGTASLAEAGPEGAVTVDAVRVGRRVHAHLALSTDRPLTQVERVLFGHAVSLIALGHELPDRDADRLRRLDATVVGLCTGAAPAGEAVAEHLAAAGLGDIRVLVAAPAAAAERALRAADAPVLVRVEGDGIVAIVGADHSIGPLGPAVRAGLSRAHPPAEGAAALAEARTAAEVARARRRPLVAFEELAGAALLAEPASREVLVRVAAVRLDPLRAYDREHRTDLVGSLRVFLEHHGQWESAAASLGVHRHTLRSRIARITEVLGGDLDDAHVRAELLLGLTAWADPDQR